MSKLEKMTITPCSVEKNGDIKSHGSGIKVMINPASFLHSNSISYSNKNIKTCRATGSIANDLKFYAFDEEKVSFELIFDGTGVVSKLSGGIKEKIDEIRNIVYRYDGTEHQPKPIRLIWASFIFFGRLVSLDIEYTLFKPSGEPLRAKTKLSFSGYMSREEQSLRKNNSSPDMTHTIEVKSGDTLPLLCYQVYRDTSYYPEVARINGLNSLQELRPGLRLKFPPLR
jgi:hypothetical protein